MICPVGRDLRSRPIRRIDLGTEADLWSYPIWDLQRTGERSNHYSTSESGPPILQVRTNNALFYLFHLRSLSGFARVWKFESVQNASRLHLQRLRNLAESDWMRLVFHRDHRVRLN